VKVADEMIKQVGIKRFADDSSNVAWLDEKKDASARVLKEKAAAN